jgi:hypothetical protein
MGGRTCKAHASSTYKAALLSFPQRDTPAGKALYRLYNGDYNGRGAGNTYHAHNKQVRGIRWWKHTEAIRLSVAPEDELAECQCSCRYMKQS